MALLVLVAGGGMGCSGDDDSGPRDAGPATTEAEAETLTGSYVGTVQDSEAYIAIVVAGDGRTLAFVTDGGESVDWFEGTVDGKGARLTNDGGAQLEVSFTEGTTADDPSRPVVLSGTFVRPGSDPLRYVAGAAEEPAGLYRAAQTFDDGEYAASWVVLPDGSQKGAIRRFETPLPPGAVDTMLDLDDLDSLAVDVPGGVLHPLHVDPTRL